MFFVLEGSIQYTVRYSLSGHRELFPLSISSDLCSFHVLFTLLVPFQASVAEAARSFPAKGPSQMKMESSWRFDTPGSMPLEAVRAFDTLIDKVVAQGKLVSESQAGYWMATDRVFFSLCNNGELNVRLKQFEDEIGR